MTVNSNGDYEALAKLLYPSIEASGNVYYGQTRKLTMDEVFDKYKGGFESHIESRRVEDVSSEYGFKYEKYFCWTIGPLSGEFCIDRDGEHHIPMESYPLYYAKYLLNKTIVAEENVLNSGIYNSYHYDVEPKLKKVFYHGGKNPCDDSPWDGKSFYIVKDGADYYMYVAIVNGVTSQLCHSNYLTFTAIGGDVKLSLERSPQDASWDNPHTLYEYSIDGNTWQDVPYDVKDDISRQVTIEEDNSILIRFKQGAQKPDYSLWHHYFNLDGGSDGRIFASGDIKSIQQYSDHLIDNEFRGIFSPPRITNITLVTPPTLTFNTLSDGCYSKMFKNCVNLKYAPVLSAQNIAANCYNSMFEGCTSLSCIPYIGATQAYSGCFLCMFIGCENIKEIYCLPGCTVAANNWWVSYGEDTPEEQLSSSLIKLHTSNNAVVERKWNYDAREFVMPNECEVVRDFELEYTYDD